MGAAKSFHLPQSNDASIELDETRIYSPGDIVSGTLHLKRRDAHSEPVSIDLIGELGFKVAYYSIYAQAATYNERHIPFFKVSTFSIKDGEKFALCLDQQLPPSINLVLETYPYIRYALQVNLSKTKQHRHYLIVCPRVSIPPSIVQSLHFDAASHEDMHLSGSVDRDWILPGGTLRITFEIKNPNHKHVRSIGGNISMTGEFTRAECYQKIMDFIVDDVANTSEEHIASTVSLTIPSSYLAPTFTYTNGQHEFHVNISYWLLIEVHVRGVLNSVKTTIPLSVGFEPENITLEELSMPDNPHRIRFRHHADNTSLQPYYRRHSNS